MFLNSGKESSRQKGGERPREKQMGSERREKKDGETGGSEKGKEAKREK